MVALLLKVGDIDQTSQLPLATLVEDTMVSEKAATEGNSKKVLTV